MRKCHNIRRKKKGLISLLKNKTNFFTRRYNLCLSFNFFILRIYFWRMYSMWERKEVGRKRYLILVFLHWKRGKYFILYIQIELISTFNYLWNLACNYYIQWQEEESHYYHQHQRHQWLIIVVIIITTTRDKSNLLPILHSIVMSPPPPPSCFTNQFYHHNLALISSSSFIVTTKAITITATATTISSFIFIFSFCKNFSQK